MKNVLVRLEEYLPRASEAERGTIRWLLQSPESAVELGVHQLAGQTFTSPSTIIRLCRKLGFDGYKEFHKALLYELAVRKEASDEQTREIEREDSLEAIVEKVTYRNIVSLENTKKLFNMETFSTCVDLISNAENLILFGMGASLLIAKDACLKFVRVNKSCYCGDDWHLQLLYAKNSTNRDVAIAISYTGMTRETLECVQQVKKNGTPVIAITRFEPSKLVKLADYSLYVVTIEMFSRIGAMSSRTAQSNIIDILYSAYVNKNYDECAKRIIQTHFSKESEDETGV